MFDIPIEPGQKITCYLRVQTTGQIVLPIAIGSKYSILKNVSQKNLFLGICFGIFIVIFFYNLFLFFTLKDLVYFYYSLYVLASCLATGNLFGYNYHYLWPTITWFADHAITICFGLVGITSCKFIQEILQTRKNNPIIHQLITYCFYGLIFSILLSILNFISICYPLMMGLNGIVCIVGIIAGVLGWKKGYRPAKFFLIAWSVFLSSALFSDLILIKILPFTPLTFYLSTLGSVIEMILLSFALADRINILKKENEAKQNEVITHLQNSQDYLKSWKETVLIAEKLKTESQASRLEIVKDQINPHFLYNSLNVLSELLYLDTDKAAVFVKELSNVYRYVLKNKSKNLISLIEEINFIKEYIFLLKIRFGDGFEAEVKVDNYDSFEIPPLTLQVLVENAMKHNIIASNSPLKISIIQQGNFIIVQNNLQKKQSQENYSGIGLKNIDDRYFLISEQKIEIIHSDKDYCVKIPLIKRSIEQIFKLKKMKEREKVSIQTDDFLN